MRSIVRFMQNRIFMEEMKLKQGFVLFHEYYLSILLYLFEYSRSYVRYSLLFYRVIFYSTQFLFRIIIIQDRFNLNVSVRLFNELFLRERE